MDSDLLVTSDTEGTDGITGLAYVQNVRLQFPLVSDLGITYCRREFDPTAVPAPWRHG